MCTCLSLIVPCAIHGEFPIKQQIFPTLDEQLKLLSEYLNLKVLLRDWHGVADAAMDIREIEARISERKK